MVRPTSTASAWSEMTSSSIPALALAARMARPCPSASANLPCVWTASPSAGPDKVQARRVDPAYCFCADPAPAPDDLKYAMLRPQAATAIQIPSERTPATLARAGIDAPGARRSTVRLAQTDKAPHCGAAINFLKSEIGRASCRERV